MPPEVLPAAPPMVSMMPSITHLPRGMTVPDRGALPLSGVTVLLVEDSRFTSDALRLLCQRSGARMRRAETLEQARAHLRTYRPDLVIVDLGLPDGRGEELIAQIAGRGVAVIAASGDPQGRSAALRAGAAAFVEKPLPGLAAFQRLMLAALPGRFAVASTDPARAVADPIALRDDLRHAVDLLAEGRPSKDWTYLSGFLCGLARSTGDLALTKAARHLADGTAGPEVMAALLRDRLKGLTAI